MASLLNSFRRASNPESEDHHNESKKVDVPPHEEIYTVPPEGVIIQQRKPYTKEQEDVITKLGEYAKTLLLPPSDPYHPWELRFISDPTFAARYGRACKFHLQDGKHRIKATMEWRREYKPDLIKESDVSKEAETGKIILNGFDINGRPIIYMRPGRENTEHSPRQILFLIYVLERAIDLMPPGQETLVIIVDYASATTQSNPSVSTARKCLSILQSHYVERMGRAIVVKTPWWVSAFFTAVSPFLDPVTRDKLRFNPRLLDLIDRAQLDSDYGGDNHYKFEFGRYWRELNEFCHVAPDGGRLGSDGKPTVPPLGHGAKWAFEHPTPHPTPSSPQISAPSSETSSKPNGHSSTHSADFASPRVSLDGIASPTKPGPPVSDLVFDHPPSNGEKKLARELETVHVGA